MPEPVFFQHFKVDHKPDGGLLELGRGAMGITYKAFDTNLQCPVALKIINATLTNDERARERFLREARAAARLRHPNVATVLHLGRDDQSFFYAMEFIEGETLEAYVARQGKVPAVLALEIVQQVARALGAAQNEGLVHRDIKPANLMLVRHHGEDDDEGVHVKVIDFGLAKFIEKGGANPDSLNLTMAGGFVGSPYFASPEQVDEGEIDTRSDIYSLGATLWFLLAGQPPFSGSLGQVLSQHLQRPPPYEKLTALGVPEPVLVLLRRMLAKAPEDRPADPAVLRREVTVCLRALGAVTGSSSGSGPVAVAKEIPDLGQTAATMVGLPPRLTPPDLPSIPAVPPPLPSVALPSSPPLPPQNQRPPQPAANPPRSMTNVVGKSCLVAGILGLVALAILTAGVVAIVHYGKGRIHFDNSSPEKSDSPASTPEDGNQPPQADEDTHADNDESPPQPTPVPDAMTPEPEPEPTPEPTVVDPVLPPPVYVQPPATPRVRLMPMLPDGTLAIASYKTRLSERDHRSSSGERLKMVPDILRQDRANFYRFKERDPEDEADPLFASANQRARLDGAKFFGNTQNAIVNGTPLVRVDVYPKGWTVTVLSP